MNYLIVSNVNLRSTRSDKRPPLSKHYKLCIEPTRSRHFVGTYSSFNDALEAFNEECDKSRSWVQMVCLNTLEIIRSQQVFNIDCNLVKNRL